MISCLKCGKENQDHYKFCLGCGAELPRNQQRKLTMHEQPEVSGAGPLVEEPTAIGQGNGAGSLASAVAAPTGPVPCPECGYENKPTNRFCASCGYRMQVPGARVPAAASAFAEAAPAMAEAPRHGAVAGAPLAGGAAAVLADGAPPMGEPAEPVRPAEFEAPMRARSERPAPHVAPGGAIGSAPVGPVGEVSQEALSGAAVVITALLADGSEAGHYPLSLGATTLGRDTGSFFGGDGYLSPKHATLKCSETSIRVVDEGSLNGTFRKLEPEASTELRFGDVIRIGQALLTVEPLTGKPATSDGVEVLGAAREGLRARLALIVGRDSTANAFPIPAEGLHLGRERGDILFAEDGYVSGLHCRIAVEGDKLVLTDLNSSNGTFLRLREETEIASGQILLMGQQLYRVTLGSQFGR